MRFHDTPVAGAWLVEPEARSDDRGFFARLWSQDEFAAKGAPASFVQFNDSFSRLKGTLRGLHYQVDPHAEAKLVRCIGGRVFDVLVDMRPESPTYRNWFGAELTPVNRSLVYVPAGCAHGYLTLEDESEVIYLATAPYFAPAERGVRWDDPGIGIRWPQAPSVVSPKDRQWPDVGR